MLAVYAVKTCCGALVTYVEFELPAGYDTPDDCRFAREVLEKAGYAGCGKCDACGDNRYHVDFAGYLLLAQPGVEMRIVADTQDHLIEALEAALLAVRNTPNYITRIICDDKGVCIE